MADAAARIEQFRNMAEADPENELGHFSLGRALLDAGKPAEAVESLDRALAINANLGKAYQLKGKALLDLGRKPEAIETLKKGAVVAAERGELMPKNEMLATLKTLGVDVAAELPELTAAERPVEVGDGEVLDRRTGKVGRRLEKPPFRNELGRVIYENVSAESWREWIGMGTKVINELRLPLSDPAAQKVFDQHMVEFLNLREVMDTEPAA